MQPPSSHSQGNCKTFDDVPPQNAKQHQTKTETQPGVSSRQGPSQSSGKEFQPTNQHPLSAPTKPDAKSKGGGTSKQQPTGGPQQTEKPLQQTPQTRQLDAGGAHSGKDHLDQNDQTGSAANKNEVKGTGQQWRPPTFSDAAAMKPAPKTQGVSALLVFLICILCWLVIVWA